MIHNRAGLVFGGLLAAGMWMLGLPAERAAAQISETSEELVDRVVAVVGDSAVLLTDLQGEVARLRQEGHQIPSDPGQLERFVRDVLESRIDEMVLVHHAKRSGLEVDQARAAARAEEDLQRVRERFSSAAEFHQALARSGMTEQEYRAQLEAQYRSHLLREDYLGLRLGESTPPHVPDAELQQFFEANREAIGELPARISFRQVVIRPQASEAALEEARERAQEILDRLSGGEEFEALARRHSEDPGSAQRGGDLGWFRRGQMVEAFDAAVFGMRPGQTSALVETEFGVHIIRLERVRGGERQARHILIRAERTDDDVERARALAEQVAAQARAGASMRELGRQHGASEERRTVEGQPVDRLPEGYREALQGAGEGEIVGPFEVPAESGVSFVVAQVLEHLDAGAATFDDVRDQVRRVVQQERMVESLVQELRDRTYIRVML